MFKFFEKGAKIPCKHTQVFQGGYTNGGIEIYEGENKLVKYNYPLGKFVFYLDLIPLSYEEMEKDKYNFNRGKSLFDITFELNNDSILTVTVVQRYTKKKQTVVIENDKCKLSEKEIEEARKKQKNDNKPNTNLTEKMIKEKNYKYEIFNLVAKIKDSKNNSEKIEYLQKLKNIIEKFIDTFTKEVDSFWRYNKNTESIMYYEKMYFYLNYLFTAYSYLLSLETGEKNHY
jgi:molecular chaperone DnaK (HSP70)